MPPWKRITILALHTVPRIRTGALHLPAAVDKIFGTDPNSGNVQDSNDSPTYCLALPRDWKRQGGGASLQVAPLDKPPLVLLIICSEMAEFYVTPDEPCDLAGI